MTAMIFRNVLGRATLIFGLLLTTSSLADEASTPQSAGEGRCDGAQSGHWWRTAG
jgi:hypothetical protein